MTKGKFILPSLAFITLCTVAGAQTPAKSPGEMRLLPPGSITPSSPQQANWLVYDDGIPFRYFPIPDEWDDHYFNVRFTAPDSCQLIAAALLFTKFPGDSTSTNPDVHVLVWASTGLLPDTPSNNPGQALDSLVVSGEAVHIAPDTLMVSLASMGLTFTDGAKFHVGWEPDYTDTTDGTINIVADDGIPATNYSCEWWGGTENAWGTIQSDWQLSANFMIRAQVELITGQRIWLEPDLPASMDLLGPFPNPFNPEASFVIQLQRPEAISLEIFNLAGRQVAEIAGGVYPAGLSTITWRAEAFTAGIYLVRLKTQEQVRTARAVLLK